MWVCGGQGQVGPAVLRDGLLFFYKCLSSYAHIVANYLQVFMRSQLSLRSALKYLGRLKNMRGFSANTNYRLPY